MISSLFGIVMLLAGAIAFMVLAWCGFTRCSKCGEWCLGEKDCEERRRKL